MAIQLGPNNGLMDRGARGEEHYDQVMRFYRAMDMLVQGRVKSRITELPSSPANGDTYIFLGAGANMNALIRYSSALATWEIFPASNGWEMAVLDELDENGQFKVYFYQQSTSSWVARLAAGGLTVEAGDERYDAKRKNNLTATTDPTVDDDSTEDYEPLSRWINTTTAEVFLCVSATPGAANWQKATLTLDELGSAALSNVGNTGSNLPTATQVQAMIAGYQNFGPSSTATAGTKGFVPAPPATEVRRYLASDGTWQLITIADVPPPQGENVGTGPAGVFRAVVDNTLQFRRLYSSDGSVTIEQEEGRINLRASSSGGGLVTDIVETGDSRRVVTFDAGTMTLKGIKSGANVTVTESGGNLVISAEAGGGGEGGNTFALGVTASMIIYNAAEFTEEIVPFEEAAGRGITASFTAVPEDAEEPTYAILSFAVDPSTLGGLKIAGYRVEFQRPGYLGNLNMWQEGEAVFEDPSLQIGNQFTTQIVNMYQEGWSLGFGFSENEQASLDIQSSNRVFNLSQIAVGVTLYGSIPDSASPVGRVVPASDPAAIRGPYGAIQVFGQSWQADWALPAGGIYRQADYPLAALQFDSMFPDGPISIVANVPDLWARDFRAEKIISGYIIADDEFEVQRTFILGSGDPYGPWAYYQGAVTWIGSQAQGEMGPIVTITEATGPVVNGRILTYKALVVNTASGDVFVSVDAGGSFAPINYPSLTNADVDAVVDYVREDGTEGMFYKKATGGYDIALAYMDNPFNNVMTDMQPLGIGYLGAQVTCLVRGILGYDFGFAVCDGVEIHRRNSGVWESVGRVVTVDEEADGILCVKVVGDMEGAWVAILSDGRYKYFEEFSGSLFLWSDAQAVTRDGVQYEMLDGIWSGHDDFMASVRYPQPEGSSEPATVRPWRTYGIRYGDSGTGETEVWPADVRAWAPVVLPYEADYTGVAFGFVTLWAPPNSVGGPANTQSFSIVSVSTGAYGYGDQLAYFFSVDGLQGRFYVPEYPVPGKYKAVTRAF